MLCGPQTVFLLDSISTGLDSSTTFDIMNTLKVRGVVVCQDKLFDEVCTPEGCGGLASTGTTAIMETLRQNGVHVPGHWPR